MSKKKKETQGQPPTETQTPMTPENKEAAFDEILKQQELVDDWQQTWDKDAAKCLKSKNGHKDASLKLLEVIRNYRLGNDEPLFEEGEDPDLADLNEDD